MAHYEGPGEDILRPKIEMGTYFMSKLVICTRVFHSMHEVEQEAQKHFPPSTHFGMGTGKFSKFCCAPPCSKNARGPKPTNTRHTNHMNDH